MLCASASTTATASGSRGMLRTLLPNGSSRASISRLWHRISGARRSPPPWAACRRVSIWPPVPSLAPQSSRPAAVRRAGRAPGPRALASAVGGLRARLDLAAGPLVRTAILQSGPGAPGRLAIVIHHLAVDGVSWRILLADLALAWQSLGSGDPAALPPRTTSFQRWAE